VQKVVESRKNIDISKTIYNVQKNNYMLISEITKGKCSLQFGELVLETPSLCFFRCLPDTTQIDRARCRGDVAGSQALP